MRDNRELAVKTAILGLHAHGLYKVARQVPAPVLKTVVLAGAFLYGAKEVYEEGHKPK